MAGEVPEDQALFLEDRMRNHRARSEKTAPGVHMAMLAAAVAVVVWAATGIAQSPNAVRHPHARQAGPDRRRSTRCRARARKAGWRRDAPKCSPATAWCATSDPLAAQAGLEILRQGGNAIDAAVATGAVLDVTSQNDTGIGGDLFALV